MKILICAMLLVLVGCKETHQDIKFKFGQTVIVKDGFYKGLSGSIVAAWEWDECWRTFSSCYKTYYKIQPISHLVSDKMTFNQDDLEVIE